MCVHLPGGQELILRRSEAYLRGFFYPPWTITRHTATLNGGDDHLEWLLDQVTTMRHHQNPWGLFTFSLCVQSLESLRPNFVVIHHYHYDYHWRLEVLHHKIRVLGFTLN